MVYVSQFNKRNFGIIVFILSIILISSCNNNSRSDLGDVKITLKTIPDSMEIPEGKNFAILVEAENSGDYKTPIYVCVSDTRSPGAIPENGKMCVNDNLEAASGTIPSKTKISFGREFVYSDVDADSISTITASAEFEYKTSAITNVCIRGEETNAKDCKIVPLKRTKGPIYVKSINVKNEILEDTDDLNVDIELEEISDGSVVGDGLTFDAFLEGSSVQLECYDNEGGLDGSLLRWDESKTKKVINCITSQPIKVAINDLYEDNLKVELNYQYKVRVSKTLTIKNRIT